MGLDVRHVKPSPKNDSVLELDYFTFDELKNNPEFVDRYSHLFVEIDDDPGKIKVLYFTEKGYQRKGMNRNFYKDFVNDKLYFNQLEVEKAFQYLNADHINSLEDFQLNFKKNFIESFIEGESVFFASW